MQLTSALLGGLLLTARRHASPVVSEEDAARVHDEYVREHKLARPLHFPREGEGASSDTFRARHADRSAACTRRGGAAGWSSWLGWVGAENRTGSGSEVY